MSQKFSLILIFCLIGLIEVDARYSGVVYPPFSLQTPAEISFSSAQMPNQGPRRAFDAEGNWVPDSDDFGFGVEYGRSEQSPLGEDLSTLLVLSLVYLLSKLRIFSRKQRQLTCPKCDF